MALIVVNREPTGCLTVSKETSAYFCRLKGLVNDVNEALAATSEISRGPRPSSGEVYRPVEQYVLGRMTLI